MQKIYLVIDSITRHRTDGSFVRLIAPVINGNEERTVEYIKDFVRLLGFSSVLAGIKEEP